jgi:hypothetical protein
VDLLLMVPKADTPPDRQWLMTDDLRMTVMKKKMSGSHPPRASDVHVRLPVPKGSSIIPSTSKWQVVGHHSGSCQSLFMLWKMISTGYCQPLFKSAW